MLTICKCPSQISKRYQSVSYDKNGLALERVPTSFCRNPEPKLFLFAVFFYNDPSAGSPTETLLRLLLPLENLVHLSFQISKRLLHRFDFSPKNSLNLPIGSSDGRCVQRAGT